MLEPLYKGRGVFPSEGGVEETKAWTLDLCPFQAILLDDLIDIG